MHVTNSLQLINNNMPFRGKRNLKVSCLGDSITAGSFNFPYASSVWYPTHANHLLADHKSVTKTTGPNLFAAKNAVISGGNSSSHEVFDLESDSNHLVSSIAMGSEDLLPVNDRLYLLKGELDGNLSAGSYSALIVYGVESENQIVEVSRQFVAGFDMDSQDHIKVSYVFSPSFIASLDPNVKKVGVGAVLASGGQTSTARISQLEVYELTAGIALHNQGISYTTVAEGLATIEKVIKWDPDVCIVAYGTNDIRNGVSRENYYADLLRVVDILREQGIFPIIATLPPLGDDQVNYDKIPEWNEFITTKANELGIGLWDRWEAFDKGDIAFIEDGRHPTRQGYLRLGEDVIHFFI